MKFTILALVLGCAVSACLFHLHRESKFLSAGLATAGGSSQVPAAQTACHWFMCFDAPNAEPEVASGQENRSQAPIASLSKAETLMLIADAAARYQVPAAFVTSIVAAESNFDCGAISQKGAIGLMQLMPETAQQFSADPKVPAQNIDAGTRYLRWLINRYRTSSGSVRRVIAAYNAGPGMVDRYRGVPPFPETRNYVIRVLGFLKQYSPVAHVAVHRGRRAKHVDEWADLYATSGVIRPTD